MIWWDRTREISYGIANDSWIRKIISHNIWEPILVIITAYSYVLSRRLTIIKLSSIISSIKRSLKCSKTDQIIRLCISWLSFWILLISSKIWVENRKINSRIKVCILLICWIFKIRSNIVWISVRTNDNNWRMNKWGEKNQRNKN